MPRTQIARCQPSYRVIDVMRKGRKPGYVIAPASLLDESAIYRQRSIAAPGANARRASVARRLERSASSSTARGSAVKKNTYQKVICRVSKDCGFRATTHVLRATFACMMLARLEQLAKKGAPINPLLIVKILNGPRSASRPPDRYLRAVADTTCGRRRRIILHGLTSQASTKRSQPSTPAHQPRPVVWRFERIDQIPKPRGRMRLGSWVTTVIDFTSPALLPPSSELCHSRKRSGVTPPPDALSPRCAPTGIT